MSEFACVILEVCEVQFDKNCIIRTRVHIYTATHPLNPYERIKGPECGTPVTIGDNVWIGRSYNLIGGFYW